VTSIYTSSGDIVKTCNTLSRPLSHVSQIGLCRILCDRGTVSRRSFAISFTHHAISEPSLASWRSVGIGARRVAFRYVSSRPPSKPDVHLSAHPAFQEETFRVLDYSGSCHLHRGRCQSLLQGPIDIYWTRRTFLLWRPSPCRRLSRPPSTMTPPTPIRFLGGLHPSPYGPPTFTELDSDVTI
jgi:hypothetical protein